MTANQTRYLIKLDLLQYNLAEIKQKHGSNIGTILPNLEKLIEHTSKYTDAVRNSFETGNTEITGQFRFGAAKQDLLNVASDGLVRLGKNPEKYADSIAAYQLILTALKDAN